MDNMAQLEKNIALVQERARNEDIDWEDDERDGKVSGMHQKRVTLHLSTIDSSTSKDRVTPRRIGTTATKTSATWIDRRRLRRWRPAGRVPAG